MHVGTDVQAEMNREFVQRMLNFGAMSGDSERDTYQSF